MSTKTTDVQLEERGSPAARTRDGTRHGFIVPIGGTEEKIGDSRILTRFVELCGGEHAYMVVIPTASELDDTRTRLRGRVQPPRRRPRSSASDQDPGGLRARGLPRCAR